MSGFRKGTSNNCKLNKRCSEKGVYNSLNNEAIYDIINKIKAEKNVRYQRWGIKKSKLMSMTSPVLLKLSAAKAC